VSFIQELKRRNVFRVAIAYVITTWLLLQVADVVLGNIAAPGWVFKAIMLVLALGFPVVLLFAWAFEMTPAGIRKEKDVDRSQSITPDTGRKLDYTIIALLALGLGYFIWESRFSKVDRLLVLVASSSGVFGYFRHQTTHAYAFDTFCNRIAFVARVDDKRACGAQTCGAAASRLSMTKPSQLEPTTGWPSKSSKDRRHSKACKMPESRT